MIIQLLMQLQAAEKIGVAAVNAAEAAYNASVRSRASVTRVAALDPGRHQVALGAIRTAIGHVESIMGAAADAQENAAGGTPAAGVGTDGTIDKLPASRATALTGPQENKA
jgi:hypothetical protein